MLHPAIIKKMKKEHEKRSWQPVPLYKELPIPHIPAKEQQQQRQDRTPIIIQL